MKIDKNTAKTLNILNNPSAYAPSTYVSPLINKVNEWAWATRPVTVGELATKIFPEFIANKKGHTPTEWKEYYLANHKANYDSALNKLKEKFKDVKATVNNISENDLQAWLDDFLFTKTFNGLYYQDAILKDIAEKTGKELISASPQDESLGIDGYIGGKAYSIKPESYKQTLSSHHEKINATMVYYKDIDKKSFEYEIEEDIKNDI